MVFLEPEQLLEVESSNGVEEVMQRAQAWKRSWCTELAVQGPPVHAV